ncbi:MAG: hypothetical protein WBQ24_08530 [Xanthobacteraceae bacterium]
MLRGVLVPAALLPVLRGCVSQVQLANNKGQMAECSAAGLGIVSSLVAASVQHNCIDQYQKQGFHQVPAPAPSATATTSTDAPSAAVKTSAAAGSTVAKTPAKGQGQPMQCSSFGMGIVGSLTAASMQQTCQHQGIAQAASAAASAPSSGQATQK